MLRRLLSALGPRLDLYPVSGERPDRSAPGRRARKPRRGQRDMSLPVEEWRFEVGRPEHGMRLDRFLGEAHRLEIPRFGAAGGSGTARSRSRPTRIRNGRRSVACGPVSGCDEGKR